MPSDTSRDHRRHGVFGLSIGGRTADCLYRTGLRSWVHGCPSWI